MTESLRNHGDHGDATAVYVVQAPQWHRASGVTGIVVTPPVVFQSFPYPSRPSTAVEPPRDRRRVASLLFRDCTAVVLRKHGGDGGATAVLVR